MLERESKREKLIDARNREVKLQQRQREQLESMHVTEIPDEKLKQKAREAFIKSLNAVSFIDESFRYFSQKKIFFTLDENW